MLRCGRYITPLLPPVQLIPRKVRQFFFFIFFQPLFTFLYGAMPVSLWPNWSHHPLIAYAKSKWVMQRNIFRQRNVQVHVDFKWRWTIAGVANDTSKNVGLGKFCQDLEISEAFMISLEVSFFMVCFYFFESRNFLPKSLGLGFLTRISASRRVSDFTIRQ